MKTKILIDFNPRTTKYDLAIWVEGLGIVYTRLACHSPEHANKLAKDWWANQLRFPN